MCCKVQITNISDPIPYIAMRSGPVKGQHMIYSMKQASHVSELHAQLLEGNAEKPRMCQEPRDWFYSALEPPEMPPRSGSISCHLSGRSRMGCGIL